LSGCGEDEDGVLDAGREALGAHADSAAEIDGDLMDRNPAAQPGTQALCLFQSGAVGECAVQFGAGREAFASTEAREHLDQADADGDDHCESENGCRQEPEGAGQMGMR
jgi:hypothetical protein